MYHEDLAYALESAIEDSGLETVLRTLATITAEKADHYSANLSRFTDIRAGDDWASASDVIRATLDRIPDSVR